MEILTPYGPALHLRWLTAYVHTSADRRNVHILCALGPVRGEVSLITMPGPHRGLECRFTWSWRRR